ncbi:hypothetical protein TURU_005905 [Turdus rufiventris]|nr:hypothetical protein TURU_005905 [Turdus rufiventris]
MMDHFMILAVLLPVGICYTSYSQQESDVFPVTYLNVSKDLDLQRLLVEWDVAKPAHDAELAMSFEIQVHRAHEATTVWTEFHNVTLDKLGKPLHWTWDSDIPLECLDTSNRSEPQIFPKEKFLAEGSDITLCCVGGKGQTIKDFSVYPTVDVFKHSNSQVRLLTVENLSHDIGTNIHFYCRAEDGRAHQAAFFVGKPPDTPKDFSCYTQDMKRVKCTWREGETYLYGQNSPQYTLSKTSIRETGHMERNYTSSGGTKCDLVLEGTEELKEGQVNGTDDGIFISWEPRSIYDSYIIDWCNFPRLQPCDLQWKRFGPNTSSAVISSAAFVPGVRYKFCIYGSVANRASLLEKKIGYLRELPPHLDPIVRKVDLTYNSVTLSWDSYLTNDSETGFVRGYHVYVSPIQGNCNLKGSKKHILSDESELCIYTIENPEEKGYTVKHLMPNTKYKIAVKAFTGGGETPIVYFRYIDTPYNLNILYFVFLIVIVPTLVAAICHWKMKWVKECCCPVIPSPNKSKVLSFKDFKIDSEKVLKISDCLPDALAMDSDAEAQKLHPVTWSSLSSTPTEDKIEGHNSFWIYPSEKVVRDVPPTPTSQTHTCFENFAYSSTLEAESDLYRIPETLEAGKTNHAVMLYQPQCYLDIFHEDAASTTREIAERKNNLRYISQTDVRCLGERL